MKKFLKFLSVIVLMVAMNSCKKNEITSTPEVVTPYDPGASITTTIAGKVTNQNGDALNNVEITVGSTVTTTDVMGKFIIPKATLSQKAGFIKATKDGYFAGSRTIIAKEKTVNNIVIQLIKKVESGNFNTTTGGTITVATGGKIVFPVNAVVTKSGAAYVGAVKVSAYFLDPTSKNCYKEMPGDLRGITDNNNEQILTSYGMMNVELNGSNGEALQLASGKTATITFPIATTIQSKAPTTLPLWFFDETKGMWVQQGTATSNGENYVGTVSHFTWWNCDAGIGFVNYKIKLIDQNGNPIENAWVKMSRVTTAPWSSAYGISAADGTLSGLVPSNESLEMKVYTSNYWNCTNTAAIYTATVGPFTQDTDGGTITVTIPTLATTSLTIKGFVKDCGNSPVANGYAIIHFGNDVNYTQITNGVINNTKIYCSAISTGTATIDVFDMATLKQNATPITVNVTAAGVYNIDTVQACGVQNFVHYQATFVDQNGAAISNHFYVSIGTDSLGYTQPVNGSINAIISANKVLTRKVFVYNNCNGYTMVDSTQIGPFATDFNAGTINVTLPTSTTFTISGTVKDCSNNNVTNGVATIQVDGMVYNATVTNGTFSQQITRCSNTATNALINVIDIVNHQQNTTATTVSVTNTNINVGSLTACGVSVNEFLNYTLDGTTYNATPPSDSLLAYQQNLTYFSYFVNSPTGYNSLNGNFDGRAIGTFPLNLTQYSQTGSYRTNVNNTASITITEYGAVGQFIAGTFSGYMQKDSTTTKAPVSGSFRIKRSF